MANIWKSPNVCNLIVIYQTYGLSHASSVLLAIKIFNHRRDKISRKVKENVSRTRARCAPQAQAPPQGVAQAAPVAPVFTLGPG